MTPNKPKAMNSTPWIKCEKCLINLLSKDCEQHMKDCPPNLNNISYSFIKNNILYGGSLNEKENTDIKNLSTQEKDNLVFLSQSIIQLCSLSIGNWAVIAAVNDENTPPIAKAVWPTNEKSMTSILLTKNALDLSAMKESKVVKLGPLTSTKPASEVCVTILNAPKSFVLPPELCKRIQNNFINKVITSGNVLNVLFYGKMLKLKVFSIHSKQEHYDFIEDMNKLNIENEYNFYLIDKNTQWTILEKEAERNKTAKTPNSIKLTGSNVEIEEIKELMRYYFDETSNKALKCKSVLLHGHSGTGKTLIANTIAKEFQYNVVFMCPSDLYSKNSGNIEETIRESFENAVKYAPSIIILDEIDILCPSRSSHRLTDSEKRIAATILTMFDQIYELNDAKIFVLATSNKIDNIDVSFRRYGRLDREIEIPTPSPQSRKEIVQHLLAECENDVNSSELEQISRITHGFVGADLVCLCSKAVLNANKRKSVVKFDDFLVALKSVKPSAMREVQIEVPDVKWSDIGGQDKLKLILKQSVEWPLKHSQSFQRMGITPPRGVLMYGPPGCSKTMIAKALATESGLNFLSIKGPELFSKWVGESERAIREVFSKARQVAPSIVFFDEIDALGGERGSASSAASVQERVLAQLLTELDGITPLGDVTILAATNRPDRIDKALLRPGRLDRIVYVPLPDEHTRREIIKIKFRKIPTRYVDVEEIVRRTEGYSGAEVNAVCHEAAMAALEDNIEAQYVEIGHFMKALELITPRTPANLINIYEKYNQ